MLTVDAFRHSHEDRNDLVRLGFMRLHLSGAIRYREFALSEARAAGFSDVVASQQQKHTSTLLVSLEAGAKVRVLIDSEDSFFFMSPLIGEFDCIFVAGFNRAFFENGVFDPPYPWLDRRGFEQYERRRDYLHDGLGRYFHRVRPFVPIGPSLHRRTSVAPIEQKWRNARHKLGRVLLPRGTNWSSTAQDMEVRYAQMLSYRGRSADYDIVLNDSLWGWPQHRRRLHQNLSALSRRYAIHSRLSWQDPVTWDGSIWAPDDIRNYPMVTGAISDYEDMLSRSRLGVFATGFHFGWRNIMTLALFMGIPVLCDRPALEPHFPLSLFSLFYNDAGDWSAIEECLAAATPEERARIRSQNTAVYDRYMSPESVASYVLNAVGDWHSVEVTPASRHA